MKTTLFIVFFVFCAIAIWAGGFALFSWQALSAKPQSPDTKVDAILVLTGGKGRVYEGLKLFAEKKSEQLFITGVHEGTKKKEILAQWDGKYALPSCCITIGRKARSTEQNALEVQEWLQGKPYKTFLLVTGNYHMPRAAMEIRNVLPEANIILHPVEQNDLDENQELLFHLLFSEYHKTLYRFAMLSLNTILPHNAPTSSISLSGNKDAY